MNILKVLITTPPILHDHIGCEKSFLNDLGIELDLLSRCLVQERGDDFVERFHNEWNVDNERSTETLGIVLLHYTDHSLDGRYGGFPQPVCEVDENSDGS